MTLSPEDDGDDPRLADLRAYRATRDPALFARLMAAYDGLARSIARRYHIPGFDLDDLEQEARLGLMSALNKYDPDGLHRGRKFPTVAAFAMRHHIRQATGLDIADEDTLIMPVLQPVIPPWMRDNAPGLRVEFSLDRMAHFDGTDSIGFESSFHDMLGDPAPSVEQIVIARERGVEVSARLEAALVLLTSRERAIIARRYGLAVFGGDGTVQTMERIGTALNIHKSNVCRGEKRALGKLRAELAGTENGIAALRGLHERAQERRRAIRAA